MIWLAPWRSWKRWRTLAGAVFQAIGAIWLTIEIVEFFFSRQPWYGIVEQMYPWMMLVLPPGYGIWKAWPTKTVRARVRGTDVQVEIRIGDIFTHKHEGAVIIGSNTTFDTAMHDGTISRRSIQGQFTKRFFETRVEELDQKLSAILDTIETAQHLPKDEKPYGKRKAYRVGTVVPVEAGAQKAYFFAMGRLNANRAAQVDPEQFLDALPHLWNGIRDRGGMEDLLCPLLGGQFARLNRTRVTLLGEIVRSFIVASRDGKLCDNLIVVVSPQDATQGQIDMDVVARLLECECGRGQWFGSNAGPRLAGQPIQ